MDILADSDDDDDNDNGGDGGTVPTMGSCSTVDTKIDDHSAITFESGH